MLKVDRAVRCTLAILCVFGAIRLSSRVERPIHLTF